MYNIIVISSITSRERELRERMISQSSPYMFPHPTSQSTILHLHLHFGSNVTNHVSPRSHHLDISNLIMCLHLIRRIHYHPRSPIFVRSI